MRSSSNCFTLYPDALNAVLTFSCRHLSSGAAAKLAGIPRVVFLSKLADYGVDTFRLSPHDLAQETSLV